MDYILEFNNFKFKEGDIVLIHYWYNQEITPVKILERVKRKFRVSHNVDGSDIKNAPEELIETGDIISLYRKSKG